MKRSEALAIIKLYKDESPEVILSALEIEAGNPDIWGVEDENDFNPTPWAPKTFKNDLEYQVHRAHYQLMKDLARDLFK